MSIIINIIGLYTHYANEIKKYNKIESLFE